jgi:hypothetical protein
MRPAQVARKSCTFGWPTAPERRTYRCTGSGSGASSASVSSWRSVMTGGWACSSCGPKAQGPTRDEPVGGADQQHDVGQRAELRVAPVCGDDGLRGQQRDTAHRPPPTAGWLRSQERTSVPDDLSACVRRPRRPGQGRDVTNGGPAGRNPAARDASVVSSISSTLPLVQFRGLFSST